MGGDGTKTTWHVGYFPKTLIRVKTEKAYKINMPSHSIYRDYIFWLPVGFVKKAYRIAKSIIISSCRSILKWSCTWKAATIR